MADILVAMVVAFFPTVLTVMGIYVALKAPKPEKHAVWLWAFGIVGVLGVVAVGTATWWAGHEQEETTHNLTEQIRQVQIQEAATKGELTGIKDIMEAAVKTGIPGVKDFAESIVAAIKVSSQNRQISSGVQPPAIQKMPNAQLRSQVIDLATQMRNTATDCERASETLINQQMAATRAAANDADRAKIWSDFTQRQTNLYLSQSQQIQSMFFGPADEYRHELLRRLGPSNPEDMKEFPFTFWMGNIIMDSNPSSNQLNPTAQYLEALARRLPQ